MQPLIQRACSALMAMLITSSPAIAADSHRSAPVERLFISGHSLTDNPLPGHLAAIARSLGTPLQWNRQYMVGSSIRARVRGAGTEPESTGWDGYRQGFNREGENLNVLSELRHPRTVSGGAYDALLITEEHELLNSLLANDTVRYLRHYHDRFIEGNATGRTFFYESWLGIDDKNDPRRWIAYERAASPVWQCLVTRINSSLASEGRGDRIASLPAGLALAGLIEQATQGSGVPGISGASVRETVDRLVKDNVHLTALGSYYAALVSYATIFDRSPLGAWAPEGVGTTQARALQTIAWQFVSDHRANHRVLTLDQCRALLQRSFIATFWGYLRDISWRKDLGTVHATLRWARHLLRGYWRLSRNDATNPLYYDAATDKDYWFPAP